MRLQYISDADSASPTRKSNNNNDKSDVKNKSNKNNRSDDIKSDVVSPKENKRAGDGPPQHMSSTHFFFSKHQNPSVQRCLHGLLTFADHTRASMQVEAPPTTPGHSPTCARLGATPPSSRSAPPSSTHSVNLHNQPHSLSPRTQYPSLSLFPSTQPNTPYT